MAVINPIHAIKLWPAFDVLLKITLAVGNGTFVGLERQHRGKAGIRTFALAALLGAMGGLLGGVFGPLSMLFVAMFILLLNIREIVDKKGLALTTSTALAVVGFAGLMCGQGHIFTPTASCIIASMFLAWKEPLSGFADEVTDIEIRSAILLAIFSFIIYPVLPEHSIDPWGLVDPRENWIAVVAIAGIGFLNYILLKIYGAKGMGITAFLGGFINSRQVVVELISRASESGPTLWATTRQGILLTIASMFIRNGLIAGIFATQSLLYCAFPLLLMLAVTVLLWWRITQQSACDAAPSLKLESPFSIPAALKFGLIFLALNVAGGLAIRYLGSASFYVVSALGGLLSSASSITSAATLAGSHKIPMYVGANGVILSTITSILSNIPFVRAMAAEQALRKPVLSALLLIAACGLAGAALNFIAVQWLPPAWQQ